MLDKLKLGLKYKILYTSELEYHHIVLKSIGWVDHTETFDIVMERKEQGIHAIKLYEFSTQVTGLGSCVPTTLYNCIAFLLGEGKGDLSEIDNLDTREGVHCFVNKTGLNWSEQGASTRSRIFNDSQNIRTFRNLFHSITNYENVMLSELYRVIVPYFKKNDIPDTAVAAIMHGETAHENRIGNHSILAIKHENAWHLIDPHCPFMKTIPATFPSSTTRTCNNNIFKIPTDDPETHGTNPRAYIIKRQVFFNLDNIISILNGDEYKDNISTDVTTIPEFLNKIKPSLTQYHELLSPIEGERIDTNESGTEIMLGYAIHNSDQDEMVFIKKDGKIINSLYPTLDISKYKSQYVFTTYIIIPSNNKRQKHAGSIEKTKGNIVLGMGITVLCGFLASMKL